MSKPTPVEPGLHTQTRLLLAVLEEPCGSAIWSCCTDRSGRWISCESRCWSRALRSTGVVSEPSADAGGPGAIERGSLEILSRLRSAGAI